MDKTTHICVTVSPFSALSDLCVPVHVARASWPWLHAPVMQLTVCKASNIICRLANDHCQDCDINHIIESWFMTRAP